MDSKEYSFEINKSCNYESDIFRISVGSLIQFTAGPSLFGYSIELFINAPERSKPSFERGKYRQLKITSCRKSVLFEQVLFDIPGSYHFYFTIDGLKDGEGYMLVDPELTLDNKSLPLDALKCLTVVSKYLGKFSTWKDKLSVAQKANYNVVHFTPIQKLGGSNSAYSLRDQLSANPAFSDSGQQMDFDVIKHFLNTMRNEWKMLSICDIVLNHTANESEWLWDHPECSYNLVNSPHLRPAYLLDVSLAKLTQDVASGTYSHRGLPPEITSEDHIESLRHILWVDVLASAQIPQMFMVDVTTLVSEFQEQCKFNEPGIKMEMREELVIKQDPYYRKFHSTVDMTLALATFNIYWKDCFDEDSRVKKCSGKFKEKLEELNSQIESEVNSHLEAAVNNTLSTVRYFRLQPDGPKIPVVSEKEPLVPRYFVEKSDVPDGTVSWSVENDASYVMAHNGWVMNDDPLRNFASSDSNVYLRRELVAWGDSVKLRFGNGPEDCPYLWKKMREYVEKTAKLFDGVRLDNCHSTPLHVAQYLLDAARKIKPNLYIVAELFTNSVKTDNIFVNKLGITSLIRESMSAWDSHELGRLVYRYGGQPVGCLLDVASLVATSDGKSRKMTPGVAHAMFLDQTHDNPSPVEKRSPYDLLPSSALVAMASTAVGSNYGYDHLVPHHIDVVKEVREYMGSADEIKLDCHGIVAAKGFLNNLHSWLTFNHFNEVFVDQLSCDVVCVTRHNRTTLESVLMFAFTSFSHPPANPCSSGSGLSVVVTASQSDILAQGHLTHRSGNRFSPIAEFKKSDKIINGLSEYELVFTENADRIEDNFLVVLKEADRLRLCLTHHFLPGSIVIVKLYPSEDARWSADKLNKDSSYEKRLHSALESVDLIDVNYLLYKSGQEESGGTYNIPGFGNLVYAGLQGIVSLAEEICEKDDQAHPLCCNIREGPWLGDYTVARLLRYQPTSKFGELLKERLDLVRALPPGMKPFYFFQIISQAYTAVRNHTFSLMSPFVQEGGDLIKALSMASLQFVGCVDSSSLPQLSSSLEPPPRRFPLPTLAAGLPHFSVDYMRCWGRDTFISVRGLLLLTGRFEEARWLILGFGACLRHGLIPNLLASGITPRYNCRDAVWWWLQTIKEFVTLSPNFDSILFDPVRWLFPTDSPCDSPKDVPLHELVQRCLEVHFQGLCFREHNAGKQIDEHMTSQGFDNQIGVNPQTGFVFGGNEWNCGTWMDKMGSSYKASTKGRPATPRDGSAVELVGLSYSVISWLDRLHKKRAFPHSSVTRSNLQGEKTTWTWSEWAARIKDNFENEFWIGPEHEGPFVNKRNIYKDSVGAHNAWEDYRLRPNFLIALTVAPELFIEEHVRAALEVVESYLVGPLGIKTLDPDDMWYIPDYDNSNDSDDAKVANGFNYHQGPEWVWPMGYYLRAQLHYNTDSSSLIARKLSVIWSHLNSSPWRGLPELTNDNGSFCKDSCHTQAWSVATILEALYDLDKVKSIKQ